MADRGLCLSFLREKYGEIRVYHKGEGLTPARTETIPASKDEEQDEAIFNACWANDAGMFQGQDKFNQDADQRYQTIFRPLENQKRETRIREDKAQAEEVDAAIDGVKSFFDSVATFFGGGSEDHVIGDWVTANDDSPNA